jgi:hypothetical protein
LRLAAKPMVKCLVSRACKKYTKTSILKMNLCPISNTQYVKSARKVHAIVVGFSDTGRYFENRNQRYGKINGLLFTVKFKLPEF